MPGKCAAASMSAGLCAQWQHSGRCSDHWRRASGFDAAQSKAWSLFCHCSQPLFVSVQRRGLRDHRDRRQQPGRHAGRRAPIAGRLWRGPHSEHLIKNQDYGHIVYHKPNGTQVMPRLQGAYGEDRIASCCICIRHTVRPCAVPNSVVSCFPPSALKSHDIRIYCAAAAATPREAWPWDCLCARPALCKRRICVLPGCRPFAPCERRVKLTPYNAKVRLMSGR